MTTKCETKIQKKKKILVSKVADIIAKVRQLTTCLVPRTSPPAAWVVTILLDEVFRGASEQASTACRLLLLSSSI